MLALACTPAMCAAGAPTTRPAAARAPDLRLAAPAPTRRRRSSVVVAPPAALPYLAEVGDKLPVEKAELPNWLALAAFAAAAVAKQANLSFQLTQPALFTALSVYTLAWAALAALEAQSGFDRVGSAVGPAFLAVNALGGLNGAIPPFAAAAAGFGVFLADALPAFPYSRWVWLATLAGALYKNLPAEWLVAAFGLSAAWRLLQQAQGGSVRPQEVALVVLAAWAFYKKVEGPAALAIMFGHLIASMLT